MKRASSGSAPPLHLTFIRHLSFFISTRTRKFGMLLHLRPYSKEEYSNIYLSQKNESIETKSSQSRPAARSTAGLLTCLAENLFQEGYFRRGVHCMLSQSRVTSGHERPTHRAESGSAEVWSRIALSGWPSESSFKNACACKSRVESFSGIELDLPSFELL